MARVPSPAIWSAGGVVTRRDESGRAEYLLVYRDRYDDWSLPKGKLDSGESFKQAARREIREETGVRGPIVGRIGTIAYETTAGNWKVVRYWLVEASKGEFRPNSEVSEVAWLRARKARGRLTYERDRAVLTRAQEMIRKPGRGRIYLTRHANAGDRNQWRGPDRLRPLSKRGITQAEALTDFFTHVPVEAIFTSPYERCEETVGPLAQTLGLHLRRRKALSEAANPKELGRFISDLGATSAVLSSQGDIIGPYIERLAGKGVPLEGPLEWKKGSIWALETQDGRVRSARYVPPPS